MRVRDSVAFVTGANRGIGLAFVQELLAAGARKVYAAARARYTSLGSARRSGRHRYGKSADSSKGQARRGSLASAECNRSWPR